jgi:hypothetical protein
MNTLTKLTPAQKAALTRGLKKAYSEHEQRMEKVTAERNVALDKFCPIRDSIIEGLEQKRDEAIAKANAVFLEQSEKAQQQFEYMIRKESLAFDEMHNKSFQIYLDISNKLQDN